MATGGENFSYSVGSEDFYDIVCDPCQEDGELHKAVGMCIDCQDHLCHKCYDAHKIARPFRKHELLDKEAMLQCQVSITRDKCTEKCAVHEDKVIKYYCINHNHLGCSVCITLDHRTCDNVRYISHVAKDLANYEEYQQVESQLNSVVERSKKVTEDNKQKTESLKKNCSQAVKMVQKFRKDINEILDKVETDLLQQCETVKSEETAKIAQIVNTLKSTHRELFELMDMKETYQNNKQNCKLYTFMMNIKGKLRLADERMKEVEKEQSQINSQIKFVANQETLKILKLTESLGKVLTSGTPSTVRLEQTKNPARQKEQTTRRLSGTSSNATTEQTQTPFRQKEQTTSAKKVEKKRIVRAEHIEDINVKCKNEEDDCDVTGLVVLAGNRLVLAHSGNVKLVDVKHGKVITYLAIPSGPLDVAMVTNWQVAITMPTEEKVAMVNVTATAMTIDRTLDTDGMCWGVDYRDGKLAVSVLYPDKIHVLTLHGRVLYTITTDQQGQDLFDYPYYVAFAQDNTSLYVSNFGNDNVVNVKFDGTVVGTSTYYTDSKLRSPHGLLIDRSGHVYVCGDDSNNIHQITPDCRKVQVLLTKADGLYKPQSISYSETDSRLYVGMKDNVVKVYRVSLGSK